MTKPALRDDGACRPGRPRTAPAADQRRQPLPQTPQEPARRGRARRWGEETSDDPPTSGPVDEPPGPRAPARLRCATSTSAPQPPAAPRYGRHQPHGWTGERVGRIIRLARMPLSWPEGIDLRGVEAFTSSRTGTARASLARAPIRLVNGSTNTRRARTRVTSPAMASGRRVSIGRAPRPESMTAKRGCSLRRRSLAISTTKAIRSMAMGCLHTCAAVS